MKKVDFKIKWEKFIKAIKMDTSTYLLIIGAILTITGSIWNIKKSEKAWENIAYDVLSIQNPIEPITLDYQCMVSFTNLSKEDEVTFQNCINHFENAKVFDQLQQQYVYPGLQHSSYGVNYDSTGKIQTISGRGIKIVSHSLKNQFQRIMKPPVFEMYEGYILQMFMPKVKIFFSKDEAAKNINIYDCLAFNLNSFDKEYQFEISYFLDFNKKEINFSRIISKQAIKMEPDNGLIKGIYDIREGSIGVLENFNTNYPQSKKSLSVSFNKSSDLLYYFDFNAAKVNELLNNSKMYVLKRKNFRSGKEIIADQNS